MTTSAVAKCLLALALLVGGAYLLRCSYFQPAGREFALNLAGGMCLAAGGVLALHARRRSD